MRTALAVLAIAAVVATPAHALGDRTSFTDVQTECAKVGEFSYGDSGRWAECHVTRGRWVATIEHTDMYQAQYCLGGVKDACEQRALLLFANRAYTPVAKLLLQRIDPRGTEYDDPLVVITDYGRILALSARPAGGAPSTSYYLWRDERWSLIESESLLRNLPQLFPD